MRLPLPDEALAQLQVDLAVQPKGIVVPAPVVSALCKGAHVDDRDDGWGVDGSTWTIAHAPGFPDVERIIVTGGETVKVQLPLTELKRMRSSTWSRGERALLESRGLRRLPWLGTDKHPDPSAWQSDGGLLLVHELASGAWESFAWAIWRESNGQGQYVEHRPPTPTWQATFAVRLAWAERWADKDGVLSVRVQTRAPGGTFPQYSPVTCDLPSGGLAIAMPMYLNGIPQGNKGTSRTFEHYRAGGRKIWHEVAQSGAKAQTSQGA